MPVGKIACLKLKGVSCFRLTKFRVLRGLRFAKLKLRLEGTAAAVGSCNPVLNGAIEIL